MMLFRSAVFFLFAKRGLQCAENGFVQWLDDMCAMGGEHNHLYTPGLHFLKTVKCQVRFCSFHHVLPNLQTRTGFCTLVFLSAMA